MLHEIVGDHFANDRVVIDDEHVRFRGLVIRHARSRHIQGNSGFSPHGYGQHIGTAASTFHLEQWSFPCPYHTSMDEAKRILVIEDDPILRDLLAEWLLAAGFCVAVAADGGSGIAEARARRPALVVTDIHMPGTGGAAVISEVGARLPGNSGHRDLGTFPLRSWARTRRGAGARCGAYACQAVQAQGHGRRGDRTARAASHLTGCGLLRARLPHAAEEGSLCFRRLADRHQRVVGDVGRAHPSHRVVERNRLRDFNNLTALLADQTARSLESIDLLLRAAANDISATGVGDPCDARFSSEGSHLRHSPGPRDAVARSRRADRRQHRRAVQDRRRPFRAALLQEVSGRHGQRALRHRPVPRPDQQALGVCAVRAHHGQRRTVRRGGRGDYQHRILRPALPVARYRRARLRGAHDPRRRRRDSRSASCGTVRQTASRQRWRAELRSAATAAIRVGLPARSARSRRGPSSRPRRCRMHRSS